MRRYALYRVPILVAPGSLQALVSAYFLTRKGDIQPPWYWLEHVYVCREHNFFFQASTWCLYSPPHPTPHIPYHQSHPQGRESKEWRCYKRLKWIPSECVSVCVCSGGGAREETSRKPPHCGGLLCGEHSVQATAADGHLRQLVEGGDDDGREELLSVRMETTEAPNMIPGQPPSRRDGSHTSRGPWLFLRTSNLCRELKHTEAGMEVARQL